MSGLLIMSRFHDFSRHLSGHGGTAQRGKLRRLPRVPRGNGSRGGAANSKDVFVPFDPFTLALYLSTLQILFD